MVQTFDIFEPRARDTGTVFASPHSGRDYPEAFISQSPLSFRHLRSSEDAFVDLLFDGAPLHGAPLLVALRPRAYVDLNRAPEELDPSLIEGLRRSNLNPRVASGLGVIPRVVSKGRVIHPARISAQEAERRLVSVWHPYHRALTRLMEEAKLRHGGALLIDCHSMPREALSSVGERGAPLPEIVLGNRYGASCGAGIMAEVEAAFREAGFRVATNVPFAGAYIAQTYGRPSAGHHVVQVEIDRSLYIDEESLRPLDTFETMRARLFAVTRRLAEIGRGFKASALAAE